MAPVKKNFLQWKINLGEKDGKIEFIEKSNLTIIMIKICSELKKGNAHSLSLRS